MKAAETVVLLRAVDDGEDQEVVGNVGQRDPHLGAVEDVVIAIAHDGRLDRTGVGTGVRLGQPKGGDLVAVRLGNEPALLLLFGAPIAGAPGC